MNFETFDIDQPLSFQRVGNPDSLRKIFLLHSSGRNADSEQPRLAATRLTTDIKNAEVILVNGMVKKAKPHPVTGQVAYDWGSIARNHSLEPKLIEIIRSFNATAENTVLFGHSEGGFRAARLAYRNPGLAKHVILHSSALLFDHFKGHPAEGNPVSFDTIISPTDPYLKMPIAIGAIFHAKNSASLAHQGHITKTTFARGFNHAITERSLDTCVDILKQRLGLD